MTERTSGAAISFHYAGPNLRRRGVAKLSGKIGGLNPMPDFVVASGSLPPGAPADFYGRLAKVVSAKHSRFVLDSSGAALAEGLRSGGVYLSKPSMRELRGLVGRELIHEKEQEEAAMEIVKDAQAQIVVVSIGAARSASGNSERVRTDSTPAVPVKSKVGAGDSMVAGIVLGLARDMPVRDAVCLGIACGTATVICPEPSFAGAKTLSGLFASN